MKSKDYESDKDLQHQDTESDHESSSENDSEDDSKQEKNLCVDPYIQFEKWKSVLLKKIGFGGKYSWETYGSEDYSLALHHLYQFLKHMLKFSENKASEDNIIYESLNLVLERVIPIPHKLYEEVLDAINETAGGLQHVRELPHKKILEILVKVINAKNESSLLAKDYLDRGKLKRNGLDSLENIAEENSDKFSDVSDTDTNNVTEEFNQRKSYLQNFHAIILHRMMEDKAVSKLIGKYLKVPKG